MTALDDVLKLLPQMVDHKRILVQLRNSLDNVRLETVREMGKHFNYYSEHTNTTQNTD